MTHINLDEIWLLFLSIAIINFFAGFIFGLNFKKHKIQTYFNQLEEVTYCEGFKNGVFYVVDDQGKQFFRPEIARRSYEEYRIFKNGLNEH